MSLRSKLLISFLTLVAVAVLVAAAGFAIIASFNTTFNDIVQNDIPALTAVSKLQATGSSLVEVARSIQEVEISQIYERLDLHGVRERQFLSLADDLDKIETANPEAIDAVQESVNELVFEVGSFVGLAASPNPDPIRMSEVDKNLEAAQLNFTTRSDELLTALQTELQPKIDTANTATHNLYIFGIIAGISLVIGGVTLGVYLANTIVRPLRQLTLAVDQLRAGKQDVQIAIESQDEIGQLAQSFNQMSSELLQTTVSRDYVENILQAMGSILIVADEQGIIQTSNPFSQQLLDYSEQDMRGRDVKTLFKDLEVLELDVATTRTSIIPRSGEAISVSLSRRRVADSNLVVYNAQDLSQIERIQRQLLEAQSEIEAQSRHSNRIYTMMDLMRRQLNNVFEHGASREELRDYMNVLNEEFEKLSQAIKETD